MKERCARAEVLAGAIALDEASAAEREEYRNHLATCPSCVRAFGGEREIERVMTRVAHARAAETWEPLPRRRASHAHVIPLRAAAIVLAGAIVFAPQVVAVERMAVVPTYRVVLARQTAPPRPAQRLIVVPSIASTPIPAPARNVAAGAFDEPVAQATAPASNVPIWRRDEAMPAQNETSIPVFSGRADSIVMMQAPADGTTGIEIAVDGHGAPVRCTVTKSSGRPEVDAAVCKAAMSARYAPSQQRR